MSAHGQFGLVRQRRFGPFFATQFLGALNDNVLKNAIVIAFTWRLLHRSALRAHPDPAPTPRIARELSPGTTS
jgi:hypothetical protein